MKSDQFIDALQRVEQDGNLDPMVGLFADDAELTNPHVEKPLRGQQGARAFWSAYREAFDSIKSSFRTTIEADDTSSLEWISVGTLKPTGEHIRYSGVTILEWSGERISRFATYFDTRRVELDLTSRQHARSSMTTSGVEHASY